MEPWRNSTPFFGAAAFCMIKIDIWTYQSRAIDHAVLFLSPSTDWSEEFDKIWTRAIMKNSKEKIRDQTLTKLKLDPAQPSSACSFLSLSFLWSTYNWPPKMIISQLLLVYQTICINLDWSRGEKKRGTSCHPRYKKYLKSGFDRKYSFLETPAIRTTLNIYFLKNQEPISC